MQHNLCIAEVAILLSETGAEGGFVEVQIQFTVGCPCGHLGSYTYKVRLRETHDK